MTKIADLHIHTHYSDSTYSPQDIIEKAIACNIACVAITDHDTIKGIEPTFLAAKNSDVEVIPGIELSTEIHGKDIHMLGYFIDCEHSRLREELLRMQKVRTKRIEQMVEKLKIQGINDLNAQEILEKSQSSAIGRPHLAAALIEKGLVNSIKEAFDRYLAEDRPAYVKKYKISPYEAIDLIEASGGVAVLAHPMVSSIDELIPSLVKRGLKGLEVFYPNYSQTAIKYYGGIAKKHKLVVTGGSDAHGGTKDKTEIGKVTVPYDNVEQLKALVK